ncbi:MAG: alpha/beta hydrolase [Gammaproteobacteria bacterium]|nr:MAG: alpha/beta hydrolase [Gammaproteobacteria bacterium]
MQFNVSDETTIGYEIYGEGKPLLFLPGILGSKKTYDLVLGDLPKNRMCIVTEYSGQGETVYSQNRRQEYFCVEQHTENLIALLNHLKIGEFDLIGLSYGSVIAINLAKHLGNRVNKIALLSVLLCNKTVHYKNWNTLWGECSHDLDKFTRISLGLLFSEQFLAEMQDPFTTMRQSYSEFSEEHLQAFRFNLKSASSYDIPTAFENLDQEIICIHGETDVIHPAHEVKAYLGKVGKTDILDVIPDIGHGLHVEAPELISQKISDFLGI